MPTAPTDSTITAMLVRGNGTSVLYNQHHFSNRDFMLGDASEVSTPPGNVGFTGEHKDGGYAPMEDASQTDGGLQIPHIWTHFNDLPQQHPQPEFRLDFPNA